MFIVVFYIYLVFFELLGGDRAVTIVAVLPAFALSLATRSAITVNGIGGADVVLEVSGIDGDIPRLETLLVVVGKELFLERVKGVADCRLHTLIAVVAVDFLPVIEKGHIHRRHRINGLVFTEWCAHNLVVGVDIGIDVVVPKAVCDASERHIGEAILRLDMLDDFHFDELVVPHIEIVFHLDVGGKVVGLADLEFLDGRTTPFADELVIGIATEVSGGAGGGKGRGRHFVFLFLVSVWCFGFVLCWYWYQLLNFLYPFTSIDFVFGFGVEVLGQKFLAWCFRVGGIGFGFGCWWYQILTFYNPFTSIDFVLVLG